MDFDTLTARDRRLVKSVVRAMRKEFDAELKAAVAAEREAVLYGLKSLTALNGTGERVVRTFLEIDRLTKAFGGDDAGSVSAVEAADLAAEISAEMEAGV